MSSIKTHVIVLWVMSYEFSISQLWVTTHQSPSDAKWHTHHTPIPAEISWSLKRSVPGGWRIEMQTWCNHATVISKLWIGKSRESEDFRSYFYPIHIKISEVFTIFHHIPMGKIRDVDLKTYGNIIDFHPPCGNHTISSPKKVPQQKPPASGRAPVRRDRCSDATSRSRTCLLQGRKLGKKMEKHQFSS